jgi:prevent-host-death family protein
VRTELVTTLKRKATEILSQLENEKAPILITQHGKPAAYLVDVETYDELQRRLAVLQGIARGERAIEEGRTLSQAEAKRRMSRWLK